MEQHQGEKIALHLSCRDLKNLNTIYTSDPQVFVYKYLGKHKQPELLGHTEIIKKDLNPDFKTRIKVDYIFSQSQPILISVYDANESVLGKLTELALKGEQKESFVGSCKTTLAKLMGAKDCLSKLPLKREKTIRGHVLVFVDRVKEEDVEKTIKINWQWGGLKVLDLDIFSKSDPFAQFFRQDTQETRVLIHQTSVIKNDLNPTWESWSTTNDQLCPKSDLFYVEVWDFDKTGGHDFIGSVELSLSGIIDRNETTFQLLTKNHKNAGKLIIQHLNVIKPQPKPIVQKEITMLDYLRGGWQLSMIAGIDFTYSNQPITKPDSLHKLSTEKNVFNQYQLTLKEVGGIIISYDYDKEVPIFGFGGIPKLPTYTSKYSEDCFPVNGNKQNPFCNDIEGILKAYADAVPHVEFSGPTFIGNLLKRAKELGKQNAEEDIYTVVLIMTDGQVEDMDEAMKQIAECSILPMSIIIVGVGDENFSYMHKLDNIEEIRKHASQDFKATCRDVTQFVAFKEFKNDVYKLSAAVLDNFPKQFMEYMRVNNRKPQERATLHLSKVIL